MSNTVSQADAIHAATELLQRRDIIQAFAGRDGAPSYTLEELNAILKKENFLACKDNESTLLLPLNGGVTPVPREAVEGLKLLTGRQSGVPVINVLANTVIEDGTSGERQLNSLSVQDLAKMEQDTDKSWQVLPTGHNLTSLMNRSMENLNRFVDKSRGSWLILSWGGPARFTRMADFDLDNPGSCYSQLKATVGSSALVNQTTRTAEVNETVEKAVDSARQTAEDAARQYEEKARASQQPSGNTNAWRSSGKAPSPAFLDAYTQLQTAHLLLSQVEQAAKQPQLTVAQHTIATQLLQHIKSNVEAAEGAGLDEDETSRVDSLKSRLRQVSTRVTRAEQKLQTVRQTAAESASGESGRLSQPEPSTGESASGGGIPLPQLEMPGPGGTIGAGITALTVAPLAYRTMTSEGKVGQFLSYVPGANKLMAGDHSRLTGRTLGTLAFLAVVYGGSKVGGWLLGDGKK